MTATAIADALSEVLDPELGIDIVSMGLIYAIDEDEEQVRVAMTTTFAGCPMGGAIEESVEQRLRRERPGLRVEVVITREPPWDVAMLTPEARRWLGMPAA